MLKHTLARFYEAFVKIEGHGTITLFSRDGGAAKVTFKYNKKWVIFFGWNRNSIYLWNEQLVRMKGSNLRAIGVYRIPAFYFCPYLGTFCMMKPVIKTQMGSLIHLTGWLLRTCLQKVYHSLPSPNTGEINCDQLHVYADFLWSICINL